MVPVSVSTRASGRMMSRSSATPSSPSARDRALRHTVGIRFERGVGVRTDPRDRVVGIEPAPLGESVGGSRPVLVVPTAVRRDRRAVDARHREPQHVGFARIDVGGIQRGDMPVATMLTQQRTPVPQRDMRLARPREVVIRREQRTSERVAAVGRLQYEPGGARDLWIFHIEAAVSARPAPSSRASIACSGLTIVQTSGIARPTKSGWNP